ncbi:MAG TPA: carboxypeptidase regulatory-like domain-containing protein [Armatimonadota bacterium]|nr:carboxypeptidase regulatory-like domain-containing protein [Armatimonadota bacterium]
MSRLITALALIGLLLGLIVPAGAVAPPPDPWPSINAQAVWANGKLHWAGGTGPSDITDAVGHTYWSNRGSGHSVYDPTTNTWTGAKWDSSGPMGIDTNLDGYVTVDEGTYPGTSQSFAYDKNGDGVQEVWIHAGYPSWDGNFWVYDPATDSWAKVGIPPSHMWGPPETGTKYYQCQYLGVSALDETTGKVYCYGGGFWGPTSDCFAVYDIQSDTWMTLSNGPINTLGIVGTVINGKLYVTAGKQAGVFAYDIASDTWDTTPVAELSVAIDRPAVCKYNGKMYIFGGRASTGDIPDIQVFDPTTNTVTKLGDMPVGMSRNGGVIAPDGTIYVGGGTQEPVGGPRVVDRKWWKANINSTPLSWTALPDDPAYFPYEDWTTGETTIEGTVTYNGVPVPGAIVGLKYGKSATADATIYAVTDSNGHYGPVYVADHGWRVSAWKDGFAPAEDVVIFVSDGIHAVVDITLPSAAGKNVALNVTTWMTSTADGSHTGDLAIDGDLGTMWWTPWYPTEAEWLILDLDNWEGNNIPIEGATIWWQNGIARDYKIQILRDANPLYLYLWDDPMSDIETVYETKGTMGGYPIAPETKVDPIRFEPGKSARGIRLIMSRYDWPPCYTIREFVVHSSVDRAGLVYGIVKDELGNPINNAPVQIGGYGGRAIFTDATGAYSFGVDPGDYELYGDAFGYKGKKEVVTLPGDGTALNKDIILEAKAETSVFNGDFELVTNPWEPNVAEGWQVVSDNPQYFEGMYALYRDTNNNTTPGGSGSAAFAYVEHNPEAPYWAWGWMQQTQDNLYPIVPGNTYNFYFNARGEGSQGAGFWRLIWRDAFYNQVGEVIPWDIGYWYPSGDWSRVYIGRLDDAAKPMLQITPPDNAAWAEVRIGFSQFWDDPYTGRILVDDIVIDEMPSPYTPLTSLSDAKKMEDGTLVLAANKRITGLNNDVPANNIIAGGIPANTGYIEEADRSSAIRIDISNWTGDTWVGQGDSVNVRGTIGTTAEGEKFIAVEELTWNNDARPLDAVGMNNRFAQTSLAQGLFVKLWGKVTAVGTDNFTITDGSDTPITVYCGELAKPAVDQYVRVRGIISTNGTSAILYMRNDQVDWVDAASEIQPLPFQGPLKALRDYLFLGPFGDESADMTTQLATAYIPETTVRPSLGDVTNGKTWFRHDGFDELVDFNRIFAGYSHCTVYAHVYVWSPVAQTVDIPVGSDDSFKIFVNGVERGSFEGIRGAWYGSTNVASVPLVAGFNSVLIKIVQVDGGWGLVTQFAQPGTWAGEGWGNSTPMPGLGYVLNKP